MNFKNPVKFFVIFFLLSVLFLFNTPAIKARDLANDKPLFVIVSTDWCYACKILHPVVNELEAQYGNQVNFLHLDASNDEAVNASRLVAAQYGLAAYFDSNRNVFPKVGILCPDSAVPEKVIIGASSKQTYTDAINTFILDPNKICSINGRPQGPANGPDRPKEPEIPEIAGGRPDTPNLSDRPNEVISSGRPNELSFWTAGSPIPIYAYYQYLLIPKCSANNNIICSNGVSLNIQDVKNGGGTNFKPYDPNATRNEKGYHF
ncbi:MAG: hypothetical protein A3I68_03215 [Candidatus Melainabacteria bacterium RIFCSPLOWO2_02_FULL_35_15]|nr:MAG: hypothetical protein A3F80_05280 [Candidatus Melainabacteria bacterium RIFCSPLOWO2_12_FULL_35_11]OGI13095.1 MAG: hypothetical protein A3I68_03215 [Candidatus Melainabacteria bacterium RIFCSPLOWO2_02_FULL_35_15]